MFLVENQKMFCNFLISDPELKTSTGEVNPTQSIHSDDVIMDSCDVTNPKVDPLSVNETWKDILPGSVVWGKTDAENWWPAKVI